MTGAETHPTIPGAVEPGAAITINHPSWTRPFVSTVLSDPSFEMVGLFDAGIIERIDGDPWMFTVSKDYEGGPVLVVGGDDVAYVAFSEAAARHGACHEVGLDNIEV